MSDEFDPIADNSYSTFWPLLILIVGLLIWSGYQVYATNSQRNVYNQQFQAALPTINEAEAIKARYKSLMSDLYQTAQKDPAAAQIIKEAIQAGMLQVKQGTNAPGTPAGPTPTPPPSK